MSYTIVSVIKGKKDVLKGVGDPTNLNMHTGLYKKKVLLDYVMHQYADVVQSEKDITEIQYKLDRKILFKFKYTGDVMAEIDEEFLRKMRG